MASVTPRGTAHQKKFGRSSEGTKSSSATGGGNCVYGGPASYLGESGGWPSTTGRDYSLRAPFIA